MTRTERSIATYAMCGAEVGSIAHSRKMGASMLEAAHSATLESVKAYLGGMAENTGRQRVVAWPFDKYTYNRRTVLVVGAIVFVEGVMVALFIDAPTVGTALSGAEIAAEVVRVAKNAGSPMRPAAVGSFPCDGELAARCSPHLAEYCPVCPCPWDPAHLYELARRDARAEWVAVLEELAGEIGKTYARGKKYEELRAQFFRMEEDRLADEEAKKARFFAPKSFSATRWAAYEHRVYSALLQNWSLVVSLYNAQSEEVTPVRGDQSKDARRAAMKSENMRDVTYVARLVAMADITQKLGRYSLLLQQVAVPPWTKMKESEKLQASLVDSAATFEAASNVEALPVDSQGVIRPVCPDSKDWPNLHAAWAHLVGEKPEYNGVTLTGNAGDYAVALKEMAKWMKDLASKIGDRVVAAAHPTTKLAQICFDVKKMISRDCAAEEISAFKAICETSPVELDDPMEQYQELRMRLQNAKADRPEWSKASKAVDGGDAEATRTVVVLKSIMTEKQFYQGCEGVIYLIELCALRHSVESPVESMGSQLKRHASAGKSHDWVSKETFLGWCAPPAYTEDATHLLENCVSKHNRISPERKLKKWQYSKVVDRLMSATPPIPFSRPSNTDPTVDVQ